jgi:16S rRNA (adenine(1408)-N(1))-methyltransferase
VGTGDGRAVLAAAARDRQTLAIGIDADAASMFESSRRAARAESKGGLPNALFVIAAAEALPDALCGLARRVTVQFPWGSLLRGCLGADPRVAAGIGSLMRPGAALELLLAPADRDHLAGLPTQIDGISSAAADAFAAVGIILDEAREATPAEIRACRSSWARRLAPGRIDRSVVLVRLRSPAGVT